ncbi:MAG: lysoplasmalogenase [Microlunatus sp.]
MPHRRSTVALSCFVAVAIVGLIAEFAAWHGVNWICRLLLMPLLVWLCWAGAVRRTRLLTLVMIALGFSWLGDFAGFTILLKIGFFLIAQILYIVAFRPYWRHSLLRRPPLLIAYVVALAALIGVSAVAAGPLGVPVAVYGASLALMAVLATGVSRLTGIGGLLFLLSDIVLAVEFFIAPGAIPHGAFVNMAIYLPAQLLIALGTLRAVSAEVGDARDPVA